MIGEEYMFEEIDRKNKWVKIDKINKGWSDDTKYYIETVNGEKLLLRVSNITKAEAKKKEYEIVCKYNEIGINMSKPVAFGVCNNGENVYSLLTWVDGVDLEQVLPKLSMNEQYSLGRNAGDILRKIHRIQVPENEIPQETKRRKIRRQIQRYIESDLRMPGDEEVLNYINDNLERIWAKLPVYQHGDFHPGNLILSSKHKIGVIDFNRWAIGDPYEEFYKLESFATDVSIPYCVGQIDAYFQDQVPDEFWEILAVYVAHASLYSIKWAEKFGQNDIHNMVRIYRKIMKHYNNFSKIIPCWYEDYKRDYK